MTTQNNVILIVDNDEDALEVMGHEFTSRGLEILIAHNGKEALEVIDHHNVAAVVTDISMPFMNGIELSKEIIGNLPVVIVTGCEAQFEDKVVDLCDSYVDKLDLKECLYQATMKAMERHEINKAINAEAAAA
ncbi:MAG: response regulator [Halobacteriovoraceae bacterium]|nr:response regulator [Halobacteriovoraceae bacterium]